jgi:hypothetical protein
MEAKAPGGLFVGTNGEWHDAEGKNVPKAEAEARIRERERQLRTEGREPEHVRLAREELVIRENAARLSAERTGLTGALQDIRKHEEAQSDADLLDRIGGASTDTETAVPVSTDPADVNAPAPSKSSKGK